MAIARALELQLLEACSGSAVDVNTVLAMAYVASSKSLGMDNQYIHHALGVLLGVSKDVV